MNYLRNFLHKPHLGSDILNNRKSLMTLMTVTLMTGKRPYTFICFSDETAFLS